MAMSVSAAVDKFPLVKIVNALNKKHNEKEVVKCVLTRFLKPNAKSRYKYVKDVITSLAAAQGRTLTGNIKKAASPRTSVLNEILNKENIGRISYFPFILEAGFCLEY
jgi:hypothetical protein